MAANQLNGIGMLVHPWANDGHGPYLLGTCFAFRSNRHFLTAAHCVGDLEPDRLAVFVPHAAPVTRVVGVEKHPVADVAILTVADELEGVEPFWSAVGNYNLGEDFLAFGYPESIFGPEVREPTARLFKGSYQRFFDHESHMGFRYFAGELSIGCPAGLSGGPLFRPGAHVIVTGMATENLESTTVLESVEEISSGEVKSEMRYRKVITYGIAIMLDRLSAWLDQHLPEFDSTDWAKTRPPP
jgi:hypothetical protein